jgi:hypothetical protein
MTFVQWVQLVGAFGTWALVGAYYWVGRNLERRVVFLEDFRVAALKIMAKHAALTVKSLSRASDEATKTKTVDGGPLQ